MAFCGEHEVKIRDYDNILDIYHKGKHTRAVTNPHLISFVKIAINSGDLELGKVASNSISLLCGCNKGT